MYKLFTKKATSWCHAQPLFYDVFFFGSWDHLEFGPLDVAWICFWKLRRKKRHPIHKFVWEERIPNLLLHQSQRISLNMFCDVCLDHLQLATPPKQRTRGKVWPCWLLKRLLPCGWMKLVWHQQSVFVNEATCGNSTSVALGAPQRNPNKGPETLFRLFVHLFGGQKLPFVTLSLFRELFHKAWNRGILIQKTATIIRIARCTFSSNHLFRMWDYGFEWWKVIFRCFSLSWHLIFSGALCYSLRWVVGEPWTLGSSTKKGSPYPPVKVKVLSRCWIITRSLWRFVDFFF